MLSDERLQEAAQAEPVQDFDSAYITLGDIKEMAQELLAYREAEQKNFICWRKEYPEEGGICADGLADTIADELREDGETTEEIQLAVSLPNRKMRVWLTGDEDREIHWEWMR